MSVTPAGTGFGAATGFALGRDQGEARWFNGALIIVKAGAETTDGRYAAVEFRAAKGFAAPLHTHRDEDEVFLVLDGNVRLQLDDAIIEGEPGTLVYSTRGTRHSFHIDSDEARLLLSFGPAGVERFFREGSVPARSLELPRSDEKLPDRQTIMEIATRYGQQFVGPPLPPKD